MRKTVPAVILCALLLTLLSGCRIGAHEIDEWAYVFTIGVDKGVSDKFRFTYQFPSFNSQSGSGNADSISKSKEGGDLAVMTIDCPTFYSGVTMLSSALSRTLNFMHSKYLIISEDIARESVEPFVYGMLRSPQIRRNMYIFIVKGAASDFINEFNPRVGTSVSKSQELLMQRHDTTELYDAETFNEFVIDLKSTYTQPTATLAAVNDFSAFKKEGPQEKEFRSNGAYSAGELPRTGGNKYEFLGLAVFKGQVMVGTLNGDETRAVSLLNGRFGNSAIVIPDPSDPELRLGALVSQREKPDVKVTFDGYNPKIDVTVHLDGNLQNIQSDTPYEYEKKAQAEEAFRAFIKSTLDQSVEKCRALNCDVFDFGLTAARQFLTIQAWEEYDWLSRFKDAAVTINVDFTIVRTGTLMMSSKSKGA
jgi:spore germination protein KC